MVKETVQFYKSEDPGRRYRADSRRRGKQRRREDRGAEAFVCFMFWYILEKEVLHSVLVSTPLVEDASMKVASAGGSRVLSDAIYQVSFL